MTAAIIFISVTLFGVVFYYTVKNVANNAYKRGYLESDLLHTQKASFAWDDGFALGKEFERSGQIYPPRNPYLSVDKK